MSTVKPETIIEDRSLPSGVPLVHRDISWVQFNGRVLEEAADPSNPLLERAKFLAISFSNLDEFYMVRVAGIEAAVASADRRGDSEQAIHLRGIRTRINTMLERLLRSQNETLTRICAELAEAGTTVSISPSDLRADRTARKVFEERVRPFVEARAIRTTELSGLRNLDLAVQTGPDLWSIVSDRAEQLLFERDGARRMHGYFLDHLLLAFGPEAFDCDECAVLRLTRRADNKIDLSNSDPDFVPDVVLSKLKERAEGQAMRLQTIGPLSAETVAAACSALKLRPDQVIGASTTLVMHGLMDLLSEKAALPQSTSKLRWPSLVPRISPVFRTSTDIFAKLRERDQLLHHPYDSFDAYVKLIEAAARDPQVVSIEQTVYRMDALSPVLELLKAAAASKKKVSVVIEPRARFDELRNLQFAEALRKAGVKVYFGFGNLKLHAKVALITRAEDGHQSLYTHLSTGNYNATTARQYTDLGIVTAHPEIGADARQFFDSVYAQEVPRSFKRLVLAPQFLARRIFAHIKEETESARAGKPARIFAKVNALVDERIIAALYAASEAGVKVDLVVRGACSLLPGVKGVSDNIRVISIVDRFLEHSRIYYFGSSRRLYLSSADWMPRNLFSRLEIAFPVLDPRLFEYLEQVVIPAYLNDTVKGRELTSSGEWRRRKGGKAGGMRAQEVFEALAAKDYLGTPIAD